MNWFVVPGRARRRLDRLDRRHRSVRLMDEYGAHRLGRILKVRLRIRIPVIARKAPVVLLRRQTLLIFARFKDR